MKLSLSMAVGAISLSLLLSSCASTGFLGFLATTQYVDKHLATVQEETRAGIAENTNEVRKVKSDVKSLSELRATMESLIGDIQKTKESTAELKKLASQMEARLNQIPKETLQELVQILQDYLKQQQNGKAQSGQNP